MSLESFIEGYVSCALWTSDNHDEVSYSELYTQADIEPASLAEMQRDCASFYGKHMHRWPSTDEAARDAGHDFWRTRNRHHCDFAASDRDDGGKGYVDVEDLIDLARAYGVRWLCEHDGKLILTGGETHRHYPNAPQGGAS